MAVSHQMPLLAITPEKRWLVSALDSQKRELIEAVA